jgi:hypothetical protein
MRKSQYDEMCGLRQIAVLWAICVLCTGFAEARPRPLLKNIGHDILEQEEEWSPCLISRRIWTLLSIPLMRFWRRSRTEGLYLYHVQRFQHLEPADTGSRSEYCHWINAKPICYVIFCLPMKFILLAMESTVSDTPVRESWWSTRNSQK